MKAKYAVRDSILDPEIKNSQPKLENKNIIVLSNELVIVFDRETRLQPALSFPKMVLI